MRYLLLISAIIILIVVSSCRKDFNTIPNFGKLEFSKDTVFLDTIFSNIGSTTYNLKVYNRSSKSITIPEIKLENGINSKYRLNVDGLSGKKFTNIDVLANDSIYIFIETTVDFNTITDPLYTDKLLFDNGNNQQNIDLITLIQDAYFIFPSKNSTGIKTITIDDEDTDIQGRFLTDDELTFTNQRSYVIYGYAVVPSDKTLTINAGAKIYFHENSGLIVDKKASLKINGTLNSKVTFEADRLANRYSKTPGQWGTIWMREGSIENEINYTIIKNGTIGLLIEGLNATSSPTLSIKNSEIYNNSSYGILGKNTHIIGENIVIGNAGQSSLACTFGGNYSFNHSTFANYWNYSIRQSPTVLVNNYFTDIDNDGVKTDTKDLTAVNFTNCIIEGANNIEFILDKQDATVFNYNIENSIIRFNDFSNSFTNNEELNFEDGSHYKNIILNGTPNFKDVILNKFIIGEKSDAVNKAKPSTISEDILGVSRLPNPDIGAYQHIIFKDE